MQPPALEAVYLWRTQLLENSRRVSLYCFRASQKHVVGNRMRDQRGLWSDPQQIVCCFTSSCPLRIIILFIKQAFGKEQKKKSALTNWLVSVEQWCCVWASEGNGSGSFRGNLILTEKYYYGKQNRKRKRKKRKEIKL